MTKLRGFLFAGLATLISIGVCGRLQASDIKVIHGARPAVIVFDNPAPANPDTIAAIAGGPAWWGNYALPCFAGTANCPDDAAGGVNVGFPFAYWPVSGPGGSGGGCNNVILQDCGTITAFANTGSASGALSANFTIKQGATVIYKRTLTNAALGGATVLPNQIVVLINGAFHLKKTAVPGTATLTVRMKVGSAVSKSTASIDLM